LDGSWLAVAEDQGALDCISIFSASWKLRKVNVQVLIIIIIIIIIIALLLQSIDTGKKHHRYRSGPLKNKINIKCN
jgi:hypothetical protein